MNPKLHLIGFGCLIIFGACSRIENIGQPPPLSQAGEVVSNPVTVAPERVALTEALHRIANDAGERARFANDRAAFAAEVDMSGEEKAALIARAPIST